VRRTAGIALAAMLVFAMPADGEADGFWYLGAGAGHAAADPKRDRFSNPLPSCRRPAFTVPFADCRVDEDDGDASWSLFAGYQATEYLALELAFQTLPDSYDVRVTDPAAPQPGFSRVSQDSEAISLRGVLTLPLRRVSAWPALEPVSVSGVVGIAHWNSDVRFVLDSTGSPAGTRIALDNTQTGNDLMLGVRLNYDVTDQIRVTGAWDHYRDLGVSDVAVQSSRFVPPTEVRTVSTSMDVLSVLVSYRFR